MNLLLPLAVALPLVVAALLAAVGTHLPPVLPDLIAIGTAAAVTAISLLLVLDSGAHPIVYWFGGWRPVPGSEQVTAPGIAFVIDSFAAAEAALAGLAVLATLIFAWRYFESIRHLFHALMLAFLGGMVGFALSGDLFNIFVFFELMSVAGYALCAYRVEQPDVLQGSLNFAILNSMGAFAMLMGIAMLYGSTGALNLVDVGTALSRQHPTGLMVASLTLITVGFLVKAGAAPFHFWLSDAYAVATAAAAAIFTAVMGELAFHVYARIYTTVFAESITGSAATAVTAALISLAVLSAVVGAVMCALEAGTKRQVAFLTVSNGGAVLAGVALLSPTGLAGAIMYIIAAGLLRGALMLGLGMVMTRLGTGDELRLRGRGRARRHVPLGVLIALCGLGLAAPPPFGPFLSLSLIYDAAWAAGYGWVAPLLATCVALSAGTVLRAAARIFLGWGDSTDPLLTEQPEDADGGEPEPEERGARRRLWVLSPAFALVLAGYGLAFGPQLAGHAIEAARALQDHTEHARLVLQSVAPLPRPLPDYRPSRLALTYGAASFAGALLVAAAGLWWQRLLATTSQRLRAALLAPVNALKALHSGGVGDYATWLVTGTAALALTWALTLR
ncbi:MAG: complex I subunit 5 family protein [Actinomycetota bacterium]|nr:complex I subunit 5 family protein [Actinomycetota bacterium]